MQGIARIPEDPTYEQFSAVSGYEEAASDIMKLPLAYSLNSGMARVIDLQTEFSFLVTGGRKTGKTNALMCIARGFVLKGADIYIIASDEWKAFATQIGARRLNPRTEECIQEIVRVSREEIHKRFIQLSEASNKAETRAIAASHKPIVFIIDDLDSYMDISKYTEFHKELERLGNFCSAAASCALYTFASAASGGLVMNSRQAPIAQLIDQGRGIVMGGKLGEADVWNLPSNVISYRQKNAALPKGTGYLITEESLEQVVFPLLVEK